MDDRVRQTAESIIGTLRHAGHTAYLAGGCVRDMLLGQPPKDYDVVTDARPNDIRGLFRRTELVGAKFGVVIVRLHGVMTEVATFRADGTYSDGRHPDEVVFGGEIEDAHRRDFTVNAIFYDPADHRVIDHVGGRADLDARLIRTVGGPDRRFAEDHLRLLRAVRFAARLGFDIHADTVAAIARHADRLPTISAERIREELKLILTHPTRADGWGWLTSTGLANHLVAGLNWPAPERARIAARLASIEGGIGFAPALAVVLRDRSPADAQSVCRSLRCTNDEVRSVAWLLRSLPRVHDPRSLELADLKMLMADDDFDDLAELLRGDLLADGAGLGPWDALMARARAIPRDAVAPAPFITGEDVLARGVPAGPDIGRILDAVYRSQLNESVRDRSAAMVLMDERIRSK
ncbi:MAG: CCA tRNA nucleotidyltransferase [Phycisphaerales bacterium]|nr:CCA tRNA nucleotidyltransferase [Phycisphaerales bacterium]